MYQLAKACLEDICLRSFGCMRTFPALISKDNAAKKTYINCLGQSCSEGMRISARMPKLSSGRYWDATYSQNRGWARCLRILWQGLRRINQLVEPAFSFRRLDGGPWTLDDALWTLEHGCSHRLWHAKVAQPELLQLRASQRLRWQQLV